MITDYTIDFKKACHDELVAELLTSDTDFRLTGSILRLVKTTQQLIEYINRLHYKEALPCTDLDLFCVFEEKNFPPKGTKVNYFFNPTINQGLFGVFRITSPDSVFPHIDIQVLESWSFDFKIALHQTFGYIPKEIFPYLYQQYSRMETPPLYTLDIEKEFSNFFKRY